MENVLEFKGEKYYGVGCLNFYRTEDGKKMFFILAVVEWDVSPHILNNAFGPKCRTKFSDCTWNPYNISIFANVEI